MIDRDPEKNFEELWTTFHNRYPFFDIRGVNWQGQYDLYRPRVSPATTDDELFEVLCLMLEPLNDGHVNLSAKIDGSKRRYKPERTPRFWQEFAGPDVDRLFETTAKTLSANGFGIPTET